MLKISQKKKVLDFILKTDSANILLDAKGVELNSLGMVSHIPNLIADKTKSSVIKGINQAFSTLEILKSHTEIIDTNKTNYLLIVTYKDLNLGQGEDFYSIFAKDKLDTILKSYKTNTNLSVDNIFILSVDDFDLIN